MAGFPSSTTVPLVISLLTAVPIYQPAAVLLAKPSHSQPAFLAKAGQGYLWPQIGLDNHKCVVGLQYRGITQAECQQNAMDSGRDFYAYAASAAGHESACTTSDSCEDIMSETVWNWKIYSERTLWPRVGPLDHKCVVGLETRGVTQAECQQLAIQEGHDYYAYAPVADGESACTTSATCEDIMEDTIWDWKIYTDGKGQVPESWSSTHTTATGAPTPKLAPGQDTCVAGDCVIWGDPHIITFDLHEHRLARHPRREAFFRTRNWKGDEISVQEEGTFWLVKSADVRIQGRYWKNKTHPQFTSLGSIAVGGPFLDGNTLVFRPLTVGNVTWNGEEILSDLPSHFANEYVRAQYHIGAELVKDGGRGKGIDVDLPKGVKLTVNRWKYSLALKVHMCQEDGQDGHCGNFNGDYTDDSQENQMPRMGRKLPPQEFIIERNERPPALM